MGRPFEPKRLIKGGLAYKLAAFFAARPDEYLSYADIQEKYDCSRKTADQAVSKLKKMSLAKIVASPSGHGKALVAFAYEEPT